MVLFETFCTNTNNFINYEEYCKEEYYKVIEKIREEYYNDSNNNIWNDPNWNNCKPFKLMRIIKPIDIYTEVIRELNAEINNYETSPWQEEITFIQHMLYIYKLVNLNLDGLFSDDD